MPAPAMDYAAVQRAMRAAEARKAQQGSGMLLAYGVLLIGVAATASTCVGASDHETALLDAIVGSCAKSGGVVLFVVAALRGKVPGAGRKRLQRRSSGYLPRVLMGCLGLSLLYRSFAAHDSAPRDANGELSPFDNAAAGVLFFLGLLGGLLAAVAAVAGASVDAADAAGAAAGDPVARSQKDAMEAKFRASRQWAEATKKRD